MKKKLLLMALCCLTIASLAACGNEANTDATATETPAPTQSVTSDVTDADATATDTTVTETPVVTEPTVAPDEVETEAPTPTPTEAPAPTEAPKELSKGEQMAKQYAESYPSMEYEIFENVVIEDGMNDIYTGYIIRLKNNGDEPCATKSYVLKPGVNYYTRITADLIETDNYDAAIYAGLKYYGEVYPVADASKYLREDELQTCEDENCLVASYSDCTTTDEYYTIVFFNDEGKAVYYLQGRKAAEFVTHVDNQLHVNISSFSDVDWATAKIIYEVQ